MAVIRSATPPPSSLATSVPGVVKLVSQATLQSVLASQSLVSSGATPTLSQVSSAQCMRCCSHLCFGLGAGSIAHLVSSGRAVSLACRVLTGLLKKYSMTFHDTCVLVFGAVRLVHLVKHCTMGLKVIGFDFCLHRNNEPLRLSPCQIIKIFFLLGVGEVAGVHISMLFTPVVSDHLGKSKICLYGGYM